MHKADINIEFAHIAFNADFDKEQVAFSSKIAAQQLSKLRDEGQICSVSILIDDKFTRHQLTLQEDVIPFIDFVSQHIDIDYICYESSLSKYMDALFACISDKYRNRISDKLRDYEAKHDGKIACSHDIAIWHLVRLGHIKTDAKTIVPVGGLRNRKLQPFQANKVISILSESDRKPEETAVKEILRFCKDTDVVSRIQRIFFDPLSGEIADS
ncbi:MAG: hypothetical protein IPN69_06950 [Acidobacteria bacterium]|nr:hypothetical protein [Acidobacteriota bacterium]